MGVCLTLQSGCMFGAPTSHILPPLGPGEERTFSIDLQAPSVAGRYQAQWRMTCNEAICGGT